MLYLKKAAMKSYLGNREFSVRLCRVASHTSGLHLRIDGLEVNSRERVSRGRQAKHARRHNNMHTKYGGLVLGYGVKHIYTSRLFVMPYIQNMFNS